MNKLFTVTVMTMLLCQTAWAEGGHICGYQFGKLITDTEGNCPSILSEPESKRQEYLNKCDEYLKLEQFYGEHPNSALELRTQYAQLAQAYCLRASLEKE